MKGTSLKAREAALAAFEPVAVAAGKDAVRLGTELFAVADILDGSGSLRRALTDPARPAEDKASLAADLLSRFDARVVEAVAGFVRGRWSSGVDLPDAVEDAGFLAVFAAAQAGGAMAEVEEQLFRFERQLVAHRSLLAALGDRTATAAGRVGVLRDVLAGRVNPLTQVLLERVVGEPRGSRLLPAVRKLVQSAADRNQRLVARVTAAVELSSAQRTRLTSILEETYRRSVQLNVAVDPEVLGGIKIQVGSEVVDGTIVTRLADAKRRLVG